MKKNTLLSTSDRTYAKKIKKRCKINKGEVEFLFIYLLVLNIRNCTKEHEKTITDFYIYTYLCKRLLQTCICNKQVNN